MHYFTISDDVYADEVCDAFSPIEKTDNGYRLTMTVPDVYFKFIVGKKGETKKRIENETETLVKVQRTNHGTSLGNVLNILL